MLTHRVGQPVGQGRQHGSLPGCRAQQPAQSRNAAIDYAGQDKGLAEPANATLSPTCHPPWHSGSGSTGVAL